MAQEYDAARVQEAIKHLQGHLRHPYPSGGLHDTYTPALLALKNALYQSGGYTHETALREARAIAKRVCPPWPQRSRLFWVLFRVRRWLRRWLPRSLFRAILGAVLASGGAFAEAPPRLLDCPEVNLLGLACEESGVSDDDVSAPPAPLTPEGPLFTLQTMRPDTPPLLLNVFNDPTEANIATYLDWELRHGAPQTPGSCAPHP